MSATITTSSRVNAAIVALQDFADSDVYFFAGRNEVWDDEGVPDVALNSPSEIRKVKRSNVFIKNISDERAATGLKRYDWEENVIYTPWDDSFDINDFNEWLSPTQPFYVFVIDSTPSGPQYNVYMCIDNNFGSASVNKPVGQDLNIVSYQDGYKWKFMYNIPSDYITFISESFIPCPYKTEDKSDQHIAVEANAIPGTIERFVIENPGSGYTTATITIYGDGTGAFASPVIDAEGLVTSFILSSSGTNYSYADVVISGDGADAVFRAVVSPLEGHGSNVNVQLGANFALFKGSLITDEAGVFPSTVNYRRIGLIKNMQNKSNVLLTGDRYDLTDQIEVSNIIGSFLYSERVVGNVSGATAVLYNISSSVFYVSDRRGTFLVGEAIHTASDPSVIATVTGITLNNINLNKGDILYYENFQPMTRRAGQSESFIFSIEF